MRLASVAGASKGRAAPGRAAHPAGRVSSTCRRDGESGPSASHIVRTTRRAGARPVTVDLEQERRTVLARPEAHLLPPLDEQPADEAGQLDEQALARVRADADAVL